jgi:hypothetical protein
MLMKRLFLMMTIVGLSACTTALAEHPAYSVSDRPSQDGRCVGDHGVGDLDRSEQACLAQIGDMVERHGPGLQLKFRNGITRIYLNEDAKCRSDGAEGCVKYQLAGYFPKHDLILIEVGYSEGVSWKLVRADAGKASDIVAPPHYSPNEQWLVSVAASIGPSGPPNGIDIVPATSDPAFKEWHYRIADKSPWLYAFAGWDGNDRVKLLATSTDAPEKHAPAVVERRARAWQLKEPAAR